MWSRALPAALLAALLAALAAGAPPATAAEDAAKLREQVLEGAFQVDTRLKSARALEKQDPELLGAALLELAEGRKNPANLEFLVSLATEQDTRLLRLLAVHAAWQSDPTKAAAAFLDRVGPAGDPSGGGKILGDDRAAARAVEGAGLVAAVQKDRAAIARLVEIAKGWEVPETGGGAGPKTEGKKVDVPRRVRVLPGIEAARAVNRFMDPRTVRDLLLAAVTTPNNHVRKHLVWAVLDLAGSVRSADKLFEPLRARPGAAGRNAAECGEILADGESKPFDWNPLALKEVPVLWKTGRPAGLETQVGWKDPEIQKKIAGWFAALRKDTPAWGHYASSVLPTITLRTAQSPEIFDRKARALLIDASEIAKCESDWQGSYVLARDAGIAFCAVLGEPSSGHRGWEPAYVDVYAFMKASRQSVGSLEEYVDQAISGKPWPK
jgi:hypothetical protein